MSVAEIKKRHESTLFIDWEKEFNPEAQPQSYSNALLCHNDRGELLDRLTAIEEILTEVENDWAPEHPPYEAEELIRRIRELYEDE